MTFTPYFDKSLNESIDTPQLHALVERVRGMSLEELGQFKDDLVTDAQIDPSIQRTKTFRVSAKVAIRAIQECRNRGEVLVVQNGRPGFFQVCEALIHGAIVGDEFVKRFKG